MKRTTKRWKRACAWSAAALLAGAVTQTVVAWGARLEFITPPMAYDVLGWRWRHSSVWQAMSPAGSASPVRSVHVNDWRSPGSSVTHCVLVLWPPSASEEERNLDRARWRAPVPLPEWVSREMADEHPLEFRRAFADLSDAGLPWELERRLTWARSTDPWPADADSAWPPYAIAADQVGTNGQRFYFDWLTAEWSPARMLEGYQQRVTAIHIRVGWPFFSFSAAFFDRPMAPKVEALNELWNPNGWPSWASGIEDALAEDGLPVKPLWGGFAANTTIFAMAWGVVGWVAMRCRRGVCDLRSSQRRRHGRCGGCGYEIRGVAICPECGRGVAQ